MAAEEFRQEVADLRQQITALASVVGVLTAALRRGGLMTAELEALLADGLASAAAGQSEQVRPAWDRTVAAVLKVAAATQADIGRP
jgi:hypothetical protein